MAADFNKNYEKLLIAVDLLKEIAEDFKIYHEDALKEVTSEQQDLLHLIENGSLDNNDEDKVAIVDHIKVIRTRRRHIKKIMDLSEQLNQPINDFIDKFNQSKHHITMMKNSFDNPIYRIRNQNIYDTYLNASQNEYIEAVSSQQEEHADLIELKTQLEITSSEQLDEEQPQITYVQSENELWEKIKARDVLRHNKQATLINQFDEEDFSRLHKKTLTKEEREAKLLARQQKIINSRKSKKKKAKALKKLKNIRIKENKKTVLDLFKELENDRQTKLDHMA